MASDNVHGRQGAEDGSCPSCNDHTFPRAMHLRPGEVADMNNLLASVETRPFNPNEYYAGTGDEVVFQSEDKEGTSEKLLAVQRSSTEQELSFTRERQFRLNVNDLAHPIQTLSKHPAMREDTLFLSHDANVGEFIGEPRVRHRFMDEDAVEGNSVGGPPNVQLTATGECSLWKSERKKLEDLKVIADEEHKNEYTLGPDEVWVRCLKEGEDAGKPPKYYMKCKRTQDVKSLWVIYRTKYKETTYYRPSKKDPWEEKDSKECYEVELVWWKKTVTNYTDCGDCIETRPKPWLIDSVYRWVRFGSKPEQHKDVDTTTKRKYGEHGCLSKEDMDEKVKELKNEFFKGK